MEIEEIVEVAKKNKVEDKEEQLNILMAYYLRKYENYVIDIVKQKYSEKVDIDIKMINIKFLKASFKSLFKEFLLENNIDSLDKKDYLIIEDDKLIVKKSIFFTEREIIEEIEKFVHISFIDKEIKNIDKNQYLKYLIIFTKKEEQTLDSLYNQFRNLVKSFEKYYYSK